MLVVDRGTEAGNGRVIRVDASDTDRVAVRWNIRAGRGSGLGPLHRRAAARRPHAHRRQSRIPRHRGRRRERRDRLVLRDVQGPGLGPRVARQAAQCTAPHQREHAHLRCGKPPGHRGQSRQGHRLVLRLRDEGLGRRSARQSEFRSTTLEREHADQRLGQRSRARNQPIRRRRPGIRRLRSDS